VLVVGTFGAGELPFPLAALREVIIIAERRLSFRGTPQAFLERAAQRSPERTPPPVELGSWYEPLDPSVPLVQLRAGSVRYGAQIVFEQLDFTVAAGQHTLIEGPNGSGKSSLLELITGDHPQAYSNDLHLFGRRRGSGETVWDIDPRHLVLGTGSDSQGQVGNVLTVDESTGERVELIGITTEP